MILAQDAQQIFVYRGPLLYEQPKLEEEHNLIKAERNMYNF